MTLLVVILFISLTFTEALHRRISPRIAGGEIVKKREDFPYQASLRIFDQHYCGAAIITNQHVLTAAHCIYDAHDQPLAAQYFTVVVGDLNLKPSADTVTKDVIRITCHDDYEPSKLSHDVAVVKLTERFNEWTPYIKSIEMTDHHAEGGTPCVISGWGYVTEAGPISERLRMLLIPMVSHLECDEVYPDEITLGMICAGDMKGGKDVCNGDAGGPLVCHGQLHGVSSWGGEECARPKQPSVFADVGYYKSWIEEITSGAYSLNYRRSNDVFLLLIVVFIGYRTYVQF